MSSAAASASASASASVAPPPPHIHLTATNHGPAVTLTLAIMLGIAVMAFGVRLYQRWPWKEMLKAEDAALAIATIASAGNAAAAAATVHAGLGQHSGSIGFHRVDQTKSGLTATFATAFATQGFANLSFALFLMNMASQRHYKNVVLGLCAIIGLWSLAAIICFALEGGIYPAESTRATWVGFGAVSILIQLAAAALAVWMIWPLKMPVLRRLEVSSWFVLCIPAIITSTVVRLIYTPSTTFGDDFTWNDTTAVIILLVETNLMCLSAACPSFRNLLSSVSTGFLVAETSRDAATRAGMSGSGSGGSYIMRSIGRRVRGQVEKVKSVTEPSENYTATVKGETKSIASVGSEAIMVRTSVAIDNRSEIEYD